MINVDKKRIKEIDDLIKAEEESGWELDDHIYRSYHYSYKVAHTRFDALKYLYLTLYLIGKVKKVDWHSWIWENMVKECQKHITEPKKGNELESSPSLTYKIFNEMINNDLPKGKGWIPTENHVVPYMGYFCFFKGILKCFLRWIKSGKTPRGFIDTWEGVCTYFISHLNWTAAELNDQEVYTKKMIEREDNNVQNSVRGNRRKRKGYTIKIASN